MLQVNGVRVVRRSPEGGEVTLLDGISFAACRAQATVIIGPSGSGKSTLIRLLNRLDDPSAGGILLNGRSILETDPLELRRRVAMVLQKPYMFEGTVLANLQRPFLYRNVPPPAAESAEVLRAVELARLTTALLGREARSLSGGEQQRVNLARALIGQPEVLLLDEPTSALDRPTTDHLAATLREVCRSQRLAVVMVTHDLRLAEHTADHLIYLEQGRIVEQGAGAEMLARPQSEAFREFLAGPAAVKE
jgi:putative ABC transport system ATP-binding protein